MKKLNLFIPITKIDEEQRLVYGVLAQEELDNSGEIFDYASSKPNFEKWSDEQFTASNGMSKGNVRAMHTSIAAGKLTDISYNDNEKLIEGCAKVVDDGEWSKVLEGVYTGFSMGGRYEKRWKDGEDTRYTAVPVEMSLVDKPCIKSALFAGMKKSFEFQLGDNLLQKSADGEQTMYVPTNDEILPVARALAKAAGKDESAWLDFTQAATDQIVAEKGDTVAVVTDPPVEEVVTDPPVAVEGEAVVAVVEGEPVAAVEGEPVAAKVDIPEGEAVEIVPEVEQLWAAKSDGKTFLKKADAVAHDLAVKKAATGEAPEPSIVEQLQAAVDAVADIAKGDVAEIEPGVVEPLNEQLGKFAAFLSDPEVVEKSIYHVSRTACAMQECASLYLAVQAEASGEGDGSAVPAAIMTAVETLGKVLIDMATEEVGELMERLRESTTEGGVEVYCYPDLYCELAVSTMGLEKAAVDEFFAKAISVSSQDKARVQKIHDHAMALGAKCADEDPKAEEADLATDETTKMAKAAGFDTATDYLSDQLAKRTKELEDIAPLVKTLMDDVTLLKSLPRAPAMRLRALGKGEDAAALMPGTVPGEGDPMSKAEEALAGLGGPELARLAIKMAQREGKIISSGQ